MILFKKAETLHKWLENQREKAIPIGFVPTMGALHQGHISLIENSVKANPITVASIFINPTQFNNQKDFDKYPVTLEKDIRMLEEAGTDALLLPSVSEMYPDGLQANTVYQLGFLETVLEGKFRPGHFHGVCMVVERLLEIVQPNQLYLGQKDYQQCMVITKLVELMGRDSFIHINICPTLREPDGLAMSSRNMRLNKQEREKAVAIYASLSHIKNNLSVGNTEIHRQQAVSMLELAGFRIDYIAIVDATTLLPVTDWDGTQKLVLLAAAFLNEIRLIDNMTIN